MRDTQTSRRKKLDVMISSLFFNLTYWKEAADSAVCFYRLDRLQNKVIAGKYGFVAQVYTALI